MTRLTKEKILLVNTVSMPLIYFKEADIKITTDEGKKIFYNGVKAMEKRETKESVENFNTLLNLFPDSPSVLNNFSVLCATSLNKPFEAFQALEFSINKNPLSFESRYNLGTFYYSNRAFKEAKSQLMQANSLTPKNSFVLNNLGLSCLALNMTEEAREYFKEIVDTNKDAYFGYHHLAHSYFLENNYELAIEELKKELILNENGIAALNDLGCFYYYNDDIGNALKYIKKAILSAKDIMKKNNIPMSNADASVRACFFNYGFILEEQENS